MKVDRVIVVQRPFDASQAALGRVPPWAYSGDTLPRGTYSEYIYTHVVGTNSTG